jgi:hypothetical protein
MKRLIVLALAACGDAATDVSSTSDATVGPELRWFAHITPWFRAGGGGGHVDIGLQYDSDAYVGKATIRDHVSAPVDYTKP